MTIWKSLFQKFRMMQMNVVLEWILFTITLNLISMHVKMRQILLKSMVIDNTWVSVLIEIRNINPEFETMRPSDDTVGNIRFGETI